MFNMEKRFRNKIIIIIIIIINFLSTAQTQNYFKNFLSKEKSGRLKEGVEKRHAWQSNIRKRERQINITDFLGTVSQNTAWSIYEH